MTDDQEAPQLFPLAQAPATLELVKGSWRKQSFEITGGGQSFAQIDYTMSGKATARSAEGTWEFSRPKGLIHRRIEVGGQVSAELDLRAWHRGGTIELGGASYAIGSAGKLGRRWSCQRDGQELFAVTEIHSFGQGKGDIELSDAGRADPNLALLLLLTIDAHHASDRESTAAAGGAAAAAGA